MADVVEVMGQQCFIPKEAGKRLGLSPWVIRNMVKCGELPGIVINSKTYVLQAGVERERRRLERDMTVALAKLEGDDDS